MKIAKINADFSVEFGKTRLERLACVAPLKITKTFALEDGGVQICAMDASPGLLAGDHYEMNWRLAKKARVCVTTQSFTRVHPSREEPCSLKTHLEIGENAVLEWFPEPMMLYQDAALSAETEVVLASGATLLAGEVWCAGRIGRGESFQFARLENRWRVQWNGEAIYASALDLQPDNFAPKTIGALSDWTHSGNFWAFGDWVEPSLVERFWEILDAQTTVYGGATPLNQKGVMVSLLGHRAHDLQELIQQFRGAALHCKNESVERK